MIGSRGPLGREQGRIPKRVNTTQQQRGHQYHYTCNRDSPNASDTPWRFGALQLTLLLGACTVMRIFHGNPPRMKTGRSAIYSRERE